MNNTYGEFLFKAKSENILECLRGISEDDIKDSCEYKIFLRGLEYFEDGLVEYFHHNKSNNTVSATVIGSMEYSIEFYIQEDGVYSSCDCPYNGVCKHTIAALLYIVREGIDYINTIDLAIPTIADSLDFLKKHLSKLSKKDLIQLVMKFAPQNFITEIHNREIKGKDSKIIFDKADKKVRKFFMNEELLFDPQGMENSLMTQLEDLKGLEANISVEIGELILFIIQSIEDAFNEGYLYIDNYYGDDYFESPAFCEYVIAFVTQLPFETKTAYLIQLNQALDEMSYSTFNGIQNSYHRFFVEHEKAALKIFINKEKAELSGSLISRLYKTLEPLLDDDERESALSISAKQDTEHFIALCQLLFEQKRYQDILDLVGDSDDTYHLHNRQVAVIYLESAQKLELSMVEISEKIINRCPDKDILHRIKTLEGSVSMGCEEIVREKNPEDLLMFYEEEGRLKDALALVLDQKQFFDTTTLSFFKRNRNHFPAETEAFLQNRIEENLVHTGKKHYVLIAESLDLMSQVNPALTRQIADEIKANYKRRTNLMQLVRMY